MADGTAYRVLALERSGHHAVINWLLGMIPGRWVYLNNVRPHTSPFDMKGGERPVYNYLGYDHDAERAGLHSRREAIIYNIEQQTLGAVISEDELARTADRQYARVVTVIVVRDPFNNTASLWRTFERKGLLFRPALFVRMWRTYEEPREGALVVNFNRWTASRSYRDGLAGALSLVNADARLDEKPTAGGGSSFEKGSIMDRWRLYADRREFVRAFDDIDWKAAEAAFGDTLEWPSLMGYLSA